jgi:hypothetical protein
LYPFAENNNEEQQQNSPKKTPAQDATCTLFAKKGKEERRSKVCIVSARSLQPR